MEINKVIKEEMDDLSWMDDVSANPLLHLKYGVIWFDRKLNMVDAERLVYLINEAGFYSYSGGEIDYSDRKRTSTAMSLIRNSPGGYIRCYEEVKKGTRRYSYGSNRELYNDMSWRNNIDGDTVEYNASDLLDSVNESVDHYLDRVVESCLILNEERKPDMEWDFSDIKDNIDKSKRNITTRGEIITYLDKFLKKIKRVPTQTKKRIIKYVLISFLGIMSIGQLTKLVNQVSEEPIKVEVTPEKKLMVSFPETTKEVSIEKIREPSQKLYDFLKYEEGDIKQKGEPVLTAYDLGDGAITIGWGHAENKSRTELVPNKTTISRVEAEKLLHSDIEESSRYVNNILNKWEKQGIDIKITQGMYNSMVSMMFNMGVGNFRKSEFIQLIKQGKLVEAKEEIKTTYVTYTGHTPRREKESQMFGS